MPYLLYTSWKKRNIQFTTNDLNCKRHESGTGKANVDIVIADYKLPQFSAPAALALLQKTKLDIPFIVVSGYVGDEDAVELMKAGAQDYLMKDKLARLVPVVKRELAEAQMRRENKKNEEESYYWYNC